MLCLQKWFDRDDQLTSSDDSLDSDVSKGSNNDDDDDDDPDQHVRFCIDHYEKLVPKSVCEQVLPRWKALPAPQRRDPGTEWIYAQAEEFKIEFCDMYVSPGGEALTLCVCSGIHLFTLFTMLMIKMPSVLAFAFRPTFASTCCSYILIIFTRSLPFTFALTCIFAMYFPVPEFFLPG
jgi:hypothetical protein